MLETLSNGVSETRRIAEMAELYDVMVCPHNWMSPLGTMVNAQLCAALPNVEILEIDLDDVPWKMDLLTRAVRDRGRRADRARPAGLGGRHHRGGRAGAPAAAHRGRRPVAATSGWR